MNHNFNAAGVEDVVYGIGRQEHRISQKPSLDLPHLVFQPEELSRLHCGRVQRLKGCHAHLNGDGVVDGADMALVLASWG